MKRGAWLLPLGFVGGVLLEWGIGVSTASVAASTIPLTGCDLGDGGDDDAGPAGAETSFCCGGRGGSCQSGASCCSELGGACPDGDFECCSGSCSGGVCVQNGFNPSCKDALGSRCNQGECACASSDDCCIGTCGASTVGGVSLDGGPSTRCCLTTGLPCSANADCCGGSCRGDTFQCE
ncbi:MAG TPA: hypothetical protein VF407_19345 [Polyangiaceae bacterium]